MRMPSSSFARPRPGARFALLCVGTCWLAACSVINHFDELKADISGAAGAGGAGGSTMDGPGGSGPAGGGPNAGGANNTAGNATMSDSGSAGTAGSVGSNDSGMAPDAPALKPLLCDEVTNSRRMVDDFSANTGGDRILS